MFGHVAFREHSSRWPTLPFLVAMALAWSFAMMQNRSSELRVSHGTMLTVAVGLSALRVGVMLIGGRRRRRERKAEADVQADELSSPEDSTADENRPTYEDVFGAPPASDGPTDQVEPIGDGEDHDPSGDGEGHDPSGEVQADDGQQISGELEANEADGVSGIDADGVGGEVEAGEDGGDWMSGDVEAGHGEADGMSGDVEQLDGEVDEPAADVEAIRSELESEEAIRRLREEFKARAHEAELRIRQRQAELEQAPSA